MVLKWEFLQTHRKLLIFVKKHVLDVFMFQLNFLRTHTINDSEVNGTICKITVCI